MAVSAQIVHQKLEEVARKMRLARAARFLISGLAIGLFFLAVFLMADASLHLGTVARWTGFLCIVIPLVAGLGIGLSRWMQNISEESVARRVELACANARNVLISTVQFDRELAQESPTRLALFKEMEDPFPAVNWGDVFDLRLFRKLGLLLAGVAVVLFAWAALRPTYFANSAARLLLPARDIAPLTHTKIESLTPGTTRVLSGKPLDISVRLAGEVPGRVTTHLREAGNRWQQASMRPVGSKPEFAFTWSEVRTPMEYYVEAGDVRSATFQVAVRARTAIRSRTANITPPPYTHAAPGKQTDFAALTNLVPGSTVALTLEFNQPVTRLMVAGGNGATPVSEKIDATHWSIRETAKSSHQLTLTFQDADELTNSETIPVEVLPDSPPQITISEPADGKQIFAIRDSSLRVRFSAADNVGLGTVALYRTTEDDPKSRLVQEWTPNGKTFSGEARIELAQFTKPNEDTATFAVIATDQNDVSGPGSTTSRPIVVHLQSAQAAAEKRAQTAASVDALLKQMIQLQKQNLEQTRTFVQQNVEGTLDPLIERQVSISDTANSVAQISENTAPELNRLVLDLNAKELPAAVLVLRNANDARDAARLRALGQAVSIQVQILAKLQGAPTAAASDATRSEIADILSGVEDLLRAERDLARETREATPAANPKLGEKQDILADKTLSVRKDLEKRSRDAALGDQEFRNRIGKAAAQFGEFKVYEQMLGAAEKLTANQKPAAMEVQKQIVVSLGKIVELLNQWQMADAEKKAEELKDAALAMEQKLAKLAEIQKEVLEKSKELARKDQFRPEDKAATDEIAKTKQLMADVIEQMLTDAHIFPDLKPSNELRSELTSIYEDVIQADKDQAAAGQLKPEQIAVQKEDGLLQAIEQAKKIAEDMEMWLPSKNETQEWKLENFDKTEMPEIPNLPLPDAFEDIVGKLLDEQQGLSQQVQDAASNQAFAMNPANGWEIRDGPMPGFGAQGKSGNERPNKNEQTGRSSGGREGMSSGEMVGDTVSNLEGSKPDVRRTNDPMQQGQVSAPGGATDARATGGGKAGGVSQRAGMDGNAPLRPTEAPRAQLNDALAAQQAILAQKTSKRYAQASLMYLKADKLAEIARWMDESRQALRAGRIKEFQDLHRRIIAGLQDTKGEMTENGVLALPDSKPGRSSEKQLLGGDEGAAPAVYKERVDDYYRSLREAE